MDYAAWQEPLARFARTMHLAVSISDGQRMLGPVIETQPFWSVLGVDTAHDPSLCPFALPHEQPCGCAREASQERCDAVRHDEFGLVHVAVPLRVDGEVAGVALAGQAFERFPDRFSVRRLAQMTHAAPERVWEEAQRCVPISAAQLRVYTELLRALGTTFLQLRHQQLLLEHQLREATQQRALLEEQRARLDEQDRRKDHFLALLGHEIRNPLAAIVNLAQLLESEPSRDLTDRLIRQVDQLTRLTDDLLDMSRITRGRIELERQVVDLVQLTQQAADPFTSRAQQTRIIEVRLPDQPLRVEGDPSRLVQIISNLLDNAVKFTEPGDRITVALEASPTQALLRVTDSGAGFDPAAARQLFEPFLQGAHHRRAGLGLGLSLVRSLVELHGGQVDASSAGPGRGSEFLVRLPRYHADAEHPHHDVLPPSSGRRYRILVVDDEPAVADSLGDVLGRFHHVRVAYDGESALVAARTFAPDVVVSDLQMPDMDGFALARLLRIEHGRPLRLVALSGYRREVDVRDAAEAGFDRLLTKPVKAADLEATLDSLAQPPQER